MGLLSLLAWSLPACSDDDDGGGGKSGSSGTGGGAGSAGASGGGGSGGGAGSGPVTCGGQECTAWKLGGLLDLKACCTDTDECGALSDAPIKQVAGVPLGCYAQNAPGNVDCDCPASPEFTNPINSEKVRFPGCCQASGSCGYRVDLTSADGPDLGCAPPWDDQGNAIASPQACTPGAANPCPEEDGGTDGGDTDAGTGDASTD